MNARNQTSKLSLLTVFLYALTLSAFVGCVGLQIPAIDPSGERIFLPNQSTSLVGSGLPAPVFDPAPSIPPCPNNCPPSLVVPTGPVIGTGVLSPQLVVTPGRLVAPVGSEVVLMSGLAGDRKNRICNRRKIRWNLTNDSVGHFVQTNREGGLIHGRILQSSHTKMSQDTADTYTVDSAQVITRGTTVPNDDIVVAAGQAWVSLTSPSAGTSHVSVWAPKEDNWETRRQTATVHWIDAQWTLPNLGIVQAGSRQVLTTKLTRISDGAPLANWVVRFQIAGGAAATLGPAGSSLVDVRTDAEGIASIALNPGAAGHGATDVQLDYIRPPSADGRESQLTVGKANTSVTWSAPGLAVKLQGPQQLQGGQTGTYRIEVSNTGDMPLTQVRVQDVLPQGLRLVSSQPQASQFGNRLEWSLADIAPKSIAVIELQCQAVADGTVRHTVTAVGGGLTHSDYLEIQVLTRALSLNVDFPQNAEQGQKVKLDIHVANDGQQVLTKVLVKITYSAGLKHVQPDLDTGPTQSIEKSFAQLIPGGFQRLPAEFIVTSQGAQWVTVVVTANGGQTARSDKRLTASEARAPEPQYGIKIDKQGPQRLRVGDTAQFVIFVKNTGDTVLTNVLVSDTYEKSFRPTKATDGVDLQIPGELRWLIPRLEPGRTERFDIDCLCVRADNGAQNQASVTCDQGVRDASQTVTEVIGQLGGGGGVGGIHPADTGPQIADVKRLIVEVADFADIIKVGGETEYLVTLKNPLQMSHKNVVVTITAPPGMSIRKVEASVPTAKVERNVVVLERIAELRAGETYPPIKVFVTGDKAGTFELKASAVSNLVSDPVEGKEQTRVVK
jgi:uncharacterized repeat protein (TIGR01451 family)